MDGTKFGKTIKIFLIDGEANGRMSCELSNWTGKAYKIPRVNLKDCVDRPELASTGVYLFLVRTTKVRTRSTSEKPNQYSRG
jgi:hypothetical protein